MSLLEIYLLDHYWSDKTKNKKQNKRKKKRKLTKYIKHPLTSIIFQMAQELMAGLVIMVGWGIESRVS